MTELMMFIVSIIGFFVVIWAVIYIKIRIPRWKGRLGESNVANKLKQLNEKKYRVLHDVLLPTSSRAHMTQIDHIVISGKGIICIETKALVGEINGKVKQRYWKQVINRKEAKWESSFYNPLWQNFAHMNAIKELIGFRDVESFVVFTKAEKISVSNTDSVGTVDDLMNKIEESKDGILREDVCDHFYQTLKNANIQDVKLRESHKKHLRELIARKRTKA